MNQNCSEYDSFQLYQDADVQPICIWGLYSFSLEKKPFSKAGTQVFFCNYYHDLWAVFEKWACFADLLSEVFKKILSKRHKTIRKSHTFFLYCASDCIRIPGRCRYLLSRLLLSVQLWTDLYIWHGNADVPEQ